MKRFISPWLIFLHSGHFISHHCTTQEKLYLVGINIRIPKSECVSVETLAKIFANRTYGSEFYVEFKEELKAYDLGLFIVSYLAQQCDTNIKCLDAGNCAEIVLEIPFNLTSQSRQADTLLFTNFILMHK